MNIDFVTVVRNFEQYNQFFTNNNFVNKYKLVNYNNCEENIPITKRFNYYIENDLKDDCWVVFCHQDLEFKEDISLNLKDLDKNSIWGPIGATSKKNLMIFLRFDIKRLRKMRIAIARRAYTVGEIGELQKGEIVKVGKFLKKPVLVDTVDCCCFLMHSSLIKKYNLKFDENLDWHLYSEDFSLNAKVNHNILTKVIQMDCNHHSMGSFGIGFEYSLVYLRNKYKSIGFASTCYDGYSYNFYKRL